MLQNSFVGAWIFSLPLLLWLLWLCIREKQLLLIPVPPIHHILHNGVWLCGHHRPQLLVGCVSWMHWHIAFGSCRTMSFSSPTTYIRSSFKQHFLASITVLALIKRKGRSFFYAEKKHPIRASKNSLVNTQEEAGIIKQKGCNFVNALYRREEVEDNASRSSIWGLTLSR